MPPLRPPLLLLYVLLLLLASLLLGGPPPHRLGDRRLRLERGLLLLRLRLH